MVEVWLPYEETEISLSLPDPIDLRIEPRKLVPEKSEAKALEKIYNQLSELDEVRVLDSFFLTEAEKSFISRLLGKLEIEHAFVSEDPNVVIDIPRYDPIFLGKGSVSTYYLESNKHDVLKSLLDKIPVSYPNNIMNNLPNDVYFIDIIVNGGAEVYDVYISEGGSHWEDLWKNYESLWSLKSELAPLIISSVGGWPWDSDISLVASSLMKIHQNMAGDGIAIVVGDGIVRDELFDIVTSIDNINSFSSLTEVYLYHLRKLFTEVNKRLYFFGGLPSTLLKHLSVKSIKNIEWMLRTIPSRMKRAISLIEDVLHIYPVLSTEYHEDIGEAEEG